MSLRSIAKGLLPKLLLVSTVFVTTAVASGSQFTSVEPTSDISSAVVLESSLSLAAVTPDIILADISDPDTGVSNVFTRDQDSFFTSYYQEASENQYLFVEDPLFAYINTGTSTLNVRTGPGTVYAVLQSVPSGTVFHVLSSIDGWYEVQYENTTAYLSADYVLLMTSSEYVDFLDSVDYDRLEVVALAESFLGTPYVYGGNGPSSFDCSGFTSYIYSQFGVSLNRTATDQLSNGVSVEKSQLVAGDLVFFRSSGTVKPVSHVGIYVGDGVFIHASTNGYEVRYDNLDTGYYSEIYVYARRIL